MHNENFFNQFYFLKIYIYPIEKYTYAFWMEI